MVLEKKRIIHEEAATEIKEGPTKGKYDSWMIARPNEKEDGLEHVHQSVLSANMGERLLELHIDDGLLSMTSLLGPGTIPLPIKIGDYIPFEKLLWNVHREIADDAVSEKSIETMKKLIDWHSSIDEEILSEFKTRKPKIKELEKILEDYNVG